MKGERKTLKKIYTEPCNYVPVLKISLEKFGPRVARLTGGGGGGGGGGKWPRATASGGGGGAGGSSGVVSEPSSFISCSNRSSSLIKFAIAAHHHHTPLDHVPALRNHSLTSSLGRGLGRESSEANSGGSSTRKTLPEREAHGRGPPNPKWIWGE
jgi:hypothetical protein